MRPRSMAPSVWLGVSNQSRKMLRHFFPVVDERTFERGCSFVTLCHHENGIDGVLIRDARALPGNWGAFGFAPHEVDRWLAATIVEDYKQWRGGNFSV